MVPTKKKTKKKTGGEHRCFAWYNLLMLFLFDSQTSVLPDFKYLFHHVGRNLNITFLDGRNLNIITFFNSTYTIYCSTKLSFMFYWLIKVLIFIFPVVSRQLYYLIWRMLSRGKQKLWSIWRVPNFLRFFIYLYQNIKYKIKHYKSTFGVNMIYLEMNVWWVWLALIQ